MKLCALLLLVLGVPSLLLAHELTDGVGTQTTFFLSPDHLKIELNLGFSAVVAWGYQTKIDLNGDNQVDNEEREQFLRKKGPELITELELYANGQRLAIQLKSISEEGMRGRVKAAPFDTYYVLEAPLPAPLPEGGWWIHYRDRTYMEETSSQYCWLPWLGHHRSTSYQIFIPRNFEEMDTGFRATGRELVFFFDTQVHTELSPDTSTVPSIEELRARTEETSLPEVLPAGSPEPQMVDAPEAVPGPRKAPGEDEKLGQLVESMLSGDRGILQLLGAVLLAMMYGALHALGPGHGKSMVAAYLIGTRGRIRDAVALGAIVTFAHTITIFLLGLLLLYLIERAADPASGATYENWMMTAFSLLSGLLLLGFGLVMARVRYRAARAGESGEHHRHHHGHHHDWLSHSHPHLQDHSHSHDLGHDHDHDPHHQRHSHDSEPAHSHSHSQRPLQFTGATTFKDLVILGLSGG
ncbi:MAG: hypothetical protein V3T77_10295, partial [Planctomycetota bacterium]